LYRPGRQRKRARYGRRMWFSRTPVEVPPPGRT
jgi:hypothetical protein